MARIRPERRPAWLALLAILAVAGCADRAIYAERSGANLKIAVSADETTPVEVNVGLQRHVAMSVPSLSEDADGNAKGEAGSMVSGFDYVNSDKVLASETNLDVDVSIRTSFASGNAATLISYPGNYEVQTDGTVKAVPPTEGGSANDAAKTTTMIATAAGDPDTVVSVPLERKLIAHSAAACVGNDQLDSIARDLAKNSNYSDFNSYVGNPERIKVELKSLITSANSTGLSYIMSVLSKYPC